MVGRLDVENLMDQQHPGCIRTPKYGHKDGPLSLCQSHKRVGMYTNRNGKLLIATREGSGELLFALRGAFLWITVAYCSA